MFFGSHDLVQKHDKKIESKLQLSVYLHSERGGRGSVVTSSYS